MLSNESESLMKQVLNDPNDMQKMLQFNTHMRERNLTLKDLGVTTRVLAHWREKQILISDSNTHRYSFAEYVWVQILSICRSFGLSIEVLKSIKLELMQSLPIGNSMESEMENMIKLIRQAGAVDVTDEEIKLHLNSEAFKQQLKAMNFSIYESLMYRCITYRGEVGIFIDESGEVKPWLSTLNLPFDPFIKSHVYISISDILNKFISNPSNDPHLKTYPLVNEKELQIIRLLRSKDVMSVEVTPLKGDVFNLQIKTGKYVSIDDANSILERLVKKDFKQIIVENRGKDRFIIANKLKKI